MCCDNCTAARRSESPAISESQLDHLNRPAVTVKTEANTDLPASHCVEQHLQDARNALLSWRHHAALHDFPHACFTSAVLLPDPILSALASKRSLTTIDNLQTGLPCPWVFAEKYGEEVLAVVKQLDEDYDAKRTADKETQRIENNRQATEKVLCLRRARESR